MYRIQLDPGPWQQYVKRADNIGLPLHEVSKKYMMESNLYATQLFEALQNQQQNQSPVAVAAPGSGGASLIQQEEEIPAGCIQFVVNTTEGTYFEVSFRSNTDDFTYTVNWGDGETGEGSSGEGYALLDHTYPDGVADYTVRVCFNNPSIIHDINFPGFD